MPFDLVGNWRTGKAFDLHTIASTFLGTDELGHNRFENTRSEMGELIYNLKYKADLSAIPKIITLLQKIGGIEKFDFFIPIPPTKKKRPVQPVVAITTALGANRGVAVLSDCLLNSGGEELKGITDPIARDDLLRKALSLKGAERVSGKKILLIDDLYRSGATFRLATELLYNEGKASSVSVLAMTKTRSNR